MTQRLKLNIRSARTILRRTCTSAVLLAALQGCNSESDEAKTTQGSTFDQPVVEQPKPPATDAVVATVTVIPGTEPKTPQTTGGEAIPLVPKVVPDTSGGNPVPAKVGRFTEIAPDTIGGATYNSSPALEYDLGHLVASTADDASISGDDRVFVTPVRGWLRYPASALDPKVDAGRFPVVVLQHGNHENWEPSYRGYDYLAENLATHGYVVLSIDVNWINWGSVLMDDWQSQSRAQLILGTLDRLRQIDQQGQVDANGVAGPLNALKGRLDFDRVGIMGHSRGGQGVSNAIKFNQTRRGVTKDDLKASLLANTYLFREDYPELAKAYVPAIAFQPAVQAKPEIITPARIDEAKFAALMEKYKHLLPASGTDAIRVALLANPSAFEVTMPGLAATVTLARVEPAVAAKPEVKAAAARVDDAAFEAGIKSYNLYYAAGRETAKPYDFKGAFMLAPTDFRGNLGLNNVPLANLLPSCDGDVNNLQGAWAYDHNRFGPEADTAPRYQILVKGANHNFYNTEWKRDDYGGGDSYCSSDRFYSIRLNRDDQMRGGEFLINSFMRYHVGGEQKFATYWNATAQLPSAACLAGKGTCDERTVLTVQKHAGKRKLIQRFEAENSLFRNALDKPISFTGFDAVARCSMALGGGDFGDCTPAQLDDFYSIMSMADHVELAWTKPGALVVTDLSGLSAKGTDTLTFRIAVVRPIGQEALVTLTDSAGRAATLTASDFSDALYNAPRPKADGLPLKDDLRDAPFAEDQGNLLLNMVTIPLKAFEGVDTNNLKELKLMFPKESGKVAITDIELQNLGRDKPAQQLVRK